MSIMNDLIDDCYYLEGKSLAQSRDAKFIETSSGIQHNIDELLVGILKQVFEFNGPKWLTNELIETKKKLFIADTFEGEPR